MMEHIIKSLQEHDLAIAIILVGLVREARLHHKQVLQHKLEVMKLRNKK
ncbi:TPA: hypothetical protein VIU19_001821 [Streptococcus pyogenes]|nr:MULTISPECIES: hypothetical protein [Streptococcus]QBX14279.1 hypothetical protein Javan133_0004 [Streptococcus phage Javan133]QBX14568.1 hypothetical protein Javan143_0003 [Streptococcus phage Javan143]UNI71035.1 hypothetical protein [Streptococcus phage phiAp1.1-Spec]BAN93733.1 hypothetical protein SDSE167_1345 [Streptococcus dysgalactiae subsp. equisimilis 167]ASO68519.1 hypothetical protein CFA72_05745 [Streptococcus pyogenes]